MDDELEDDVLSEPGVDADDDIMFSLSQLEEILASGANVTLIKKRKHDEVPGDSFSKQEVDIDIPVIDVTSKRDIESEELLHSQHNGGLPFESEVDHENLMNLEDICVGDTYFDEEGNLQTVEPLSTPKDERQGAIETQLPTEEHHSNVADPAMVQTEEAEEHDNTAADAELLQAEGNLESNLNEGRGANIRLDHDRPHTFPSKRTQPIKIPYDKWTDLQALKAYVPLDCQAVYDTIPFESQSRRKKKVSKTNKKRVAGKN